MRTVRLRKNDGNKWARNVLWLMSYLALLALPGPVLAQEENGITSPVSGEIVSGVVIIQGTAGGGSFLRYELAFFNGNDWIVFAESDQPVLNGTLAIWDTTVGTTDSPVYPDGVYQLRLRVVRQDFNYAEFFVPNITIANQGALPVATATPEEKPAGPGTALPPANTVVPTPAGGLSLPTAISSLTPFPTPSPEATARILDQSSASRPENGSANDDGNQGLLAQLQAVDTVRFGRAFRQGIMIAVALFIAFGLYLVVRGLWRWVWRRVR